MKNYYKSILKRKRSCRSGHNGKTHSSGFPMPHIPHKACHRCSVVTWYVCASSQQATRTRLSTPNEDLRSFKLTLFFCGSSVRWRDSPKFHQEGRNQLLPYLARGCLYLRAPPRRQVGNRFQTCLTSAHSSLSTAIPTSSGRAKN